MHRILNRLLGSGDECFFVFDIQSKNDEEDVDRAPWGELELSDDESSSEEEDEESDEDKADETGFITPADR